MAEQFYTILTQIGKAKMANASALGQKVEFSKFALGDGGGGYYNPVESQTELKNEVWRGPIGNVAIDENNLNWIVIENIIPASVGGFMIREAGIFDDEGNLIAIGKYPETYKPVVADGSAKDLYIRMILEVSNTAVVNLKIDPTIILATKKDIDILSNRIKKNEEDIKGLKEGTAELPDLETENKTLSGAINELDDKINDLAGEGRTTETVKSAYDKAVQAFQSGVDRKGQAIVNINSMGGNVDDSMTHSEVIDGILDIETDPSIGTTDAVAGDVAKGKKVVSEGNLLTGTLELTGNALLTHVLAGNTFYNKDLKKKEIGTMPNNGTITHTLTSQGGQFNLPLGYIGGGSVKAQFANLTPGNLLNGVNVGGVVGTLVKSPSFLDDSIGKTWDSRYSNSEFPANTEVNFNMSARYSLDGKQPLTIFILHSMSGVGNTYSIAIAVGNSIVFSWNSPGVTISSVNVYQSGINVNTYITYNNKGYRILNCFVYSIVGKAGG